MTEIHTDTIIIFTKFTSIFSSVIKYRVNCSLGQEMLWFTATSKLFENATMEELKYPPLLEQGKRAMSLRKAVLSKQENVEIKNAIGRICASPTVSCPPAVPIVVSGERIEDATVKCFKYYGIESCTVIK